MSNHVLGIDLETIENEAGEKVLVSDIKFPSLLSRARWFQVIGVLIVHTIFYFVVFNQLFDKKTVAIALSLLFAAGNGLLTFQTYTYLIHTRFINLTVFEQLKNSQIKVTHILEWMKNQFDRSKPVFIGFILLTLCDIGLGSMALMNQGNFPWLWLLAGGKLYLLSCLRRDYHRRNHKFRNIVMDYTLSKMDKSN